MLRNHPNVKTVLRRLYRTSPQHTTLAAFFLGGSVLCALLIATSVLKVAEFTVQANAAAAAEQEWLRAGVNFMNQLHLFYVSGWMLAAAGPRRTDKKRQSTTGPSPNDADMDSFPLRVKVRALRNLAE